MFGQVLDKFDAWFGRSFLIASYFPSLIFTLVNGALLYLTVPATRPPLQQFWSNAAAEKSIDLLIALALVAVFAYAVTPLIQIVTDLLEGAYLPQWLAEIVVIDESLRQEKDAEQQQESMGRYERLPEADKILDRLAAARRAGAELQAVWDAAAIRAAAELMEELHVRFYQRKPIPETDLQRAADLLQHALRHNCAENDQLFKQTSTSDREASKQLGGLHDWFANVLVPYTRTIVVDRWEHAIRDPYERAVQASLAPTYLGNKAAALQRYCKLRYGIHFNSFWPRFQLAIKDANLKTAIATSKTQLDFTVLMFALACVTTVGWTLLIGAVGTDIRVFAGVVCIGGFACAFAIRSVRWSYAAFASVVRASIDMARFDVLDALRIALPDSIRKEGPLWKQVSTLLVEHDSTVDIALKHLSKS